MVIHSTLVANPRKTHTCTCCGCAISIGQPHVRSYGMAHRGDPPYTVRVCVQCARRTNDEKTLKAIEPLDNNHFTRRKE